MRHGQKISKGTKRRGGAVVRAGVVCAAVAVVVLALEQAALAQRSGTTTSGAFGARTLGSGTGLTAGTSTFSGSRSAAGGFGTTGGLGAGGFGAGGLGGTGQSVIGATQRDMGAGQLTGNERFVRQNRQGQFVGGDTSDTRQLRTQGGSSAAALGGLGSLFQGLSQIGGANQPNQLNQGTTGRNQQPTVRVQRQVGFSYDSRAVQPAAATALAQRLTRSTRIRTLTNVEVDIQGGVAVLRGVVASAHDRDLAAQVALLEPGIYRVDNQLEVPGPAPGDGSAAP